MPFDGVPGVPTTGAVAGCDPGVLVAGFELCPGFRNADVDGASRIGVPTVGVLLCDERAGGITSW
jgi:hypothetical protein